MNESIEKYITCNYYKLLQITKKITKNHDLTQDLLHEVILQLYQKEHINLKFYDDNSIRYYIVSIIRINWISKTSPFYYKVRREFLKYSEFITNTNSDTLFEISEEQQFFEKQILFDILEKEYTELTFFHKALMELYLTLGSVNKVAKHTEIPKSSIIKYIKESKETIKNNVLKKLKEDE
jgi:hydroxymethylpyrimidine pyrophosphatase-like HAD family hydrolase